MEHPSASLHLVARLESENRRLRKKLADAEARVRSLEALAHEDPLCGVLNRRGFERQLDHALADRDRHGRSSALLYLDLDEFKAVNDRYGHAGGDAALRHVGTLLAEQIRPSDAVARLGGDEFAVLLREVTQAQAGKAADRIAAALASAEVPHGGEVIQISVSVGTAMLVDADLGAALAAADADMFARKKRNVAPRAPDRALAS